MKKNDINLFKAAGGERAKSTKRSGFFYLIVVAIIITVIAVGVGVYFNMRVMNLQTELMEKKDLLVQYQLTKKNSTVIAKSNEYLKILDNIDAAHGIDRYRETYSKLFPHATANEVEVVRRAIIESGGNNVNDPVEDEAFTPWEYEKIRSAIYDENAETDIEEKSLFYYALEPLADAQEMDPEKNIWCGYYRGYMVIVYESLNPGNSMVTLADRMMDGTFRDMQVGSDILEVDSPFMSVEVPNYTAAKCGYVVTTDDRAFNILLCPVKTVFERVFDILDEHADWLKEDMGLTEQKKSLVSYSIDTMNYTIPELQEGDNSGEKMEEPMMTFAMILPKTTDFTGYMNKLHASPFFSVVDTKNHGDSRDDLLEYYIYNVKLLFTGEY